jgi:hypothetical protein
MLIQAETAILNMAHIVEFLPCCNERTYEDTQETYLRFNVNGSEIGFTKPSDEEYQLAVMVNGSKHLVLSAAIHQAVMNQPFVSTKPVSSKGAYEEQVLQEQMIHEHLYRKCNCGSGDVWSECNGFQGDSSYCG